MTARAIAPDGTVSVVVAVYNGERFIGDALASILAQTAPPAEVLVVDDGSTDGTGGVVRRFEGVTYLRREANGGQASALNWGVASARGAYLAFLDADDVWMADKLELQLAAFAADPSLDVVFGHVRERVLGGAAPAPARDGGVLPAHLPGAMLIRRSAFERVGQFDSQWQLGSVVDWYARAQEAALRQRMLDGVVYERRIHGQNIGLVRGADRTDYLRIVKAALERRRTAESAALRLAPPTAGQRLLLKALFGPADEAAAAYRLWRQDVTFDPLDGGSIPLMPLLYFRLQELGLDDPIAPKLKGAYRKYWARNNLLLSQATRAVGLLEDAQIPALVSGGVAMLRHYPGRLGCRPTEGVTLMVATGRVPAARQVLGRSGLAALTIGEPAPGTDPFEGVEPCSIEGNRLPCVAAGKLLLDLSAQAARRGFSHDLLWVADLTRLRAAGDVLDWPQLAAEARARDGWRPVEAALRLLNDVAPDRGR